LVTKSDSNWAYFWVKVPSIVGSGSETVYMYYDNDVATMTSDGINTWNFFDDFDDNNIDDWDTWHFSGSGDKLLVSNGEVGSTGTTERWAKQSISDVIPSGNYTALYRGKVGGSQWIGIQVGIDSTDVFYGQGFKYKTTDTFRIADDNEVGSGNNMYLWEWAPSNSVYYTFRTSHVSGGKFYVFRDNVNYTSSASVNTASGHVTEVSDVALGVRYGGDVITYVALGKHSEPESTYSFGDEESESAPSPANITVNLNLPADNNLNDSLTVEFGYTPLSYGDAIYNCSLYTNISSREDNTTSIVNNTVNTITETFPSSGNYSWNVKCFNSTHGIFATSNYTINIFVSDSTPPLWNDTAGYLGSNVSEIEVGDGILLYGMGYDETGLDWAWLSTNETGSWTNRTYADVDEEIEYTYSHLNSPDKVVDENWDTYGFVCGACDGHIYENITISYPYIPFTVITKVYFDGIGGDDYWIRTYLYNWTESNYVICGETTSSGYKNLTCYVNSTNSSDFVNSENKLQVQEVVRVSDDIYETLIHYSPSQKDMNDASATWTWSNFTWSNSSLTANTTVAWKIYYNDTSGNENVTDVNTFTVYSKDFNLTYPTDTTEVYLNISSCVGSGCYQTGYYTPENQSTSNPFYILGNNGTVNIKLNATLNETLNKCMSIFLSNDSYYNDTIDYQFRGWENGTIGNRLRFDGSDDYIDLGNSSTLNSVRINFTVSAWIYPKQLKEFAYHRILDRNSTFAFFVSDTNNIGIQVINETGVQKAISTSNAVSTNKWYHVVGLYNSTDIVIYVNGTEVVSTSQVGLMHDSSALSYYIGHSSEIGETKYFNGTIDEVMFWNRTLNSTEINWIYERGLSGLASNVSTTNLIGHWAMNETHGGIVTDSSDNNLDGTLYNSSYNVTITNLDVGEEEELWEFIVLDNCTAGIYNFDLNFTVG